MRVISCQEMREMDNYAINIIGIPGIVLMENAALKVLKNIDLGAIDKIAVICGTGNNGGDGLALTRHLILKGKMVDLFIIGDMEKGTEDFKTNLNIIKNMDIQTFLLETAEDIERLKKSLCESDLTVDAIFGTGLARNVEGFFFETIKVINDFSKEVIAVDIPSGLNGDTGKPLGIAVRAHKTVTFHLMKKGLAKSHEYTGKVVVEDIGIPVKKL